MTHMRCLVQFSGYQRERRCYSDGRGTHAIPTEITTGRSLWSHDQKTCDPSRGKRLVRNVFPELISETFIVVNTIFYRELQENPGIVWVSYTFAPQSSAKLSSFFRTSRGIAQYDCYVVVETRRHKTLFFK